MGLADRQRVASGQWPVRHYADNSGHVDGGPYHLDDNDQGEQEDVFISDTPSAEAVSAPTPGDGTISNTENNLVARINRQSRELQRNLIAYEQITGRRVTAKDSRRRHAEAVETPDQVNPELSGTDEQSVKSGDWDSIALDDVETQPKDASRHYFAEFDRWMHSTTGQKTAAHAPNFIRRTAARYCQAKGIPVEALFPALGNVLREARKGEGRRANMRKRADEKLDVAAPQDRIDVEAPVRNTTDAEAQASQPDLSDFGHNAGDQDADPELSADSQIWAPGEGDSSRTSNRKADGITAVRYAEAYIAAGLAPNTPEEKWKVAGLAQTMRHGTIVDRIRLLDAVNAQRVAQARRTAGVNRGGAGSIPPGLGQRQMTAGSAHTAANDMESDVAIWLK